MTATLLVFYLIGRPGLDWTYTQSPPMRWTECWEQAEAINKQRDPERVAACVEAE